jgi:hypothetical protein
MSSDIYHFGMLINLNTVEEKEKQEELSDVPFLHKTKRNVFCVKGALLVPRKEHFQGNGE